MSKSSQWLMVVFLVLFTVPLTSAIPEDNATIQRAFVLYEGSNGDPYTIFYPFEVKRPGEISILIKTWALDPNPGNKDFEPLTLVLVDSRAFKPLKPEEWRKWVHEFNKFNPLEWIAGNEIRSFVKGIRGIFGHKEKPPAYYHGGIYAGRVETSESLKHAVDMPELGITSGQYVAILRNKGPFKAEGDIFISYPGDEWELDPKVEEKIKMKPDLVIKNITLNAEARVIIQVANRGKGVLNLAKWQAKGPEAVTLILKVDGQDWGGVTLPLLDPEKALHKPGGIVTYVSNLKLNGPARVTAHIDSSDKVMEELEHNNRMTADLDPNAKQRYKRSAGP